MKVEVVEQFGLFQNQLVVESEEELLEFSEPDELREKENQTSLFSEATPVIDQRVGTIDRPPDTRPRDGDVAIVPVEPLTVTEPEKKSLSDDGQLALLDVGEWWEEHWKQMPEFVQKDLEPFKTIYVHFESREEMEKFAKLVGQQIGLNTRSIWYPEATIESYLNRRYVDTPPPKETVEDDRVERI